MRLLAWATSPLPAAPNNSIFSSAWVGIGVLRFLLLIYTVLTGFTSDPQKHHLHTIITSMLSHAIGLCHSGAFQVPLAVSCRKEFILRGSSRRKEFVSSTEGRKSNGSAKKSLGCGGTGRSPLCTGSPWNHHGHRSAGGVAAASHCVPEPPRAGPLLCRGPGCSAITDSDGQGRRRAGHSACQSDS